MFRTLRRFVWLTASQRDVVYHAALLAADRDEAYVGQAEVREFVDYFRDFQLRATNPRPLIHLVITGLKLPKDALPVAISDEIVDLLTIWGNLPEQIARYAKPDARWFPTQEDPRDRL